MSDTQLKLMEAIARKQTVTARYNGETIKLAPTSCSNAMATCLSVH